MSFPKKDGDRFVGNMGDEMILAGGCYCLYRTFDMARYEKAKKDLENKERRSAERSSDKTE